MIRSKRLPNLLLAVLVLLTTGCGALQQTNEIISTPIPELTPTPSPIQRTISDIASTTGLNQQVFLGLTGEDWINLGISLLILLLN